ncbi:hypothetical protein Poli38472_002487 [Pythium oligandrum]|uniref:RING-type domain-containing protein n=1 Tax=Pythium oligandrum TaxID=41045 RepID=A0A8K1CHA9_PYTOL|nr:hypothetical protein Poli38472_002487 [Pythium oligandrum]|eukprot:TMW63546.1 hypothetical protein Poli38472_002487 [Pythium oligandrum]
MDEKSVIALWKAAEAHDTALVRQLLLDAYVALSLVNALHPAKLSTPLMAACLKREKKNTRVAHKVVRLLIEFSADVHARDGTAKGNTVLHYAAASNQARSVELLLSMGADPYTLNSLGHAPIDVARWTGSGLVRDILTQKTLVKQGWLDVKRGFEFQWKRRFCVVLACDASRSIVEFVIMRKPEDFELLAMVFFRVGEVTMAPAQSNVSTGNMPNLFSFSRRVVSHNCRTPEFFTRQRTIICGQPDRMGEHTKIFEFSTEDPAERDEWLALFQREQPQTLSSSVQLSPQHTSRNSAEVIPSLPVEPSAPELSSDQDDTGIAQESENVPASITEDSSSQPAQSEDSELKEQSECVICMSASRDAICVPCGHVAGCFDCLQRHAATSKTCPICRGAVQSVIRVYM